METIKIGITGGIGCGKSVVSRLLDILGVPVYLSDTEARRLMQDDGCLRQELKAFAGEEVYGEDGKLDRAFLAAHVFGHPERLCRLNAIVHPRVRDDFRRWVSAQKGVPVVAMESAILVEAGFATEVDVVVMVDAPLELRLERAMRRDGVDAENVMKRIQSQLDDKERMTYADYVIHNDGRHPLLPQVESLVEELMRKTLS